MLTLRNNWLWLWHILRIGRWVAAMVVQLCSWHASWDHCDWLVAICSELVGGLGRSGLCSRGRRAEEKEKKQKGEQK